jgi:tetratricopeptide (TPR) repeat protein
MLSRRPMSARSRRPLPYAVPLLALALAAAPVACGGGGARFPTTDRPLSAGLQVSDEQFSAAVRELLASEPGSPERSARLAGVTSRQLTRVARRFRAHAPERGLDGLAGAMQLARTRELREDALGPDARDALAGAAKELAARGDEGRAQAVYSLLARVGTAADKADAEAHLVAIAAWRKDADASSKPMLAASASMRAAVARRLLEPSEAAQQEAVAATARWIQAAMDVRDAFRTRKAMPTHEEGLEARRALETGGLVLAALFLRDADPSGALAALEKAQARDLVPSEVLRGLERVAQGPDAARWLELLRALAPDDRDEETPMDRALLRSTAFAIASEAYRLDPTQVESALVLAEALQAYGMAEAAPAVLVDAAKAHPEAKVFGAVLGITLHAMALEAEAMDPDAARRTYVAALPLLELVDKQARGKVQPSTARVRALMGDVELREGHIAEADKLLSAAAAAEPTGVVLLQLARIDRQRGEGQKALAHLKDAMATEDTRKDAGLRGEVLLLTGDVKRESGDAAGARAAFEEALTDLARASAVIAGDEKARALRVLSQVLTRFGADEQAQRALDRALDATPHDKGQTAATLGLVVAQAFLRGDLASARDGLRRALAADLDADDLVYDALWVRFLEKQLKVKSDGLADRVFASIADDGRWAGKLAAFGAGRLGPEELAAAATTVTQKTEAVFYGALARRVAGDAKSADEALRQVAASAGIDLVEVGMARELLAPPAQRTVGPPPSGVTLP